MGLVAKVVRGDVHRRTRLHTEKGTRAAISVGDVSMALASTVAVRFGYRPAVPLYAAPARRYLQEKLPAARVFEFSSGMSTLWYARRCRSLFAVEHDPEWFGAMSQRIASFANVNLVLAESEESYLGAIEQAGGAFDVISVDGVFRYRCFRRALEFLAPGGLLLVDDTDKDQGHTGADLPRIDDELSDYFDSDDILRFSGYTHGCLVPHETVICRRPL